MLCHVSIILKHASFLCIVNESRDLLVEQTSEAGVHSDGVELESGVNLETADNPDTTGKPQSINHTLCFIECLSHKSYECCI
jgi:hypothetical protein